MQPGDRLPERQPAPGGLLVAFVGDLDPTVADDEGHVGPRLGQIDRVGDEPLKRADDPFLVPVHPDGAVVLHPDGLALDVSGRPTRNHVWKDTVLVPVGGVVELLLEITNPGMWMIHCHIAEHLEAGMKTVFAVQ